MRQKRDKTFIDLLNNVRPEIVNNNDLNILESRFPQGTLTWKSTSCLLYTSPSPRDATLSRMPSSA